MLGESDGKTERKEQDMAKDQVKVDMFNWGPCVVRLKINEDFRINYWKKQRTIRTICEAN